MSKINKIACMVPLKSSGGSFAFSPRKVSRLFRGLSLKAKLARAILIVVITALLLSGCVTGSAKAAYSKYRGEFMDTFDTMVIVVAYSKSEQEFSDMFEIVHSSFLEMHRLFDIYHDYEGINNIKTINDSAGIKDVEVDERIIDMLETAKEWHAVTDGKVNIAMGAVLKIWHEYREEGIADPASAKLPPMDALREANRNTDIGNVIIDKEASTVFLKERGMSLDVGAVAKGYAAEAVADELKSARYDSVLISAGGNIRAIGSPNDGIRNKWGVGIKDPDSPLEWSTSEENILDVAFLSNASVVSSGAYERYYTVDGSDYGHLIDPKTLMPADYYKAVTVITEDSAAADILSTVLFIMPPEESLAFAKSMDAEALWVMPDGELILTSGMKGLLRDMGGANYD